MRSALCTAAVMGGVTYCATRLARPGVIQQTGTLQPLHIWIAILIGHATRFALSVIRFNQGKWRHIAIDIGPAKK